MGPGCEGCTHFSPLGWIATEGGLESRELGIVLRLLLLVDVDIEVARFGI